MRDSGFTLRMIVLLGLVGFVLPATDAHATMLEPLDFPALISRADRVFVGRVTDMRSQWKPDRSGIMTYVTFLPTLHIKGEPSGNLIIIERTGGCVGNEVHLVDMAPQFEVGEMALMFVRRTERDTYWTLGMNQGKFAIDEGVLVRNGMDVDELTRALVAAACEDSPEMLADGRATHVLHQHPGDLDRELQVELFLAPGDKWLYMPVAYFVNPANSGLPDALPAVQSGFRVWNEVTSSFFEFEYGGTTQNAGLNWFDFENVVSWQSLSGTEFEGRVAVTKCYGSGIPGILGQVDLVINTDKPWSTSGAATAYDLQSCAAHEAGHFLRLLDSFDSRWKTMYGSAEQGQTHYRTLHRDDMDGIAFLYPASVSVSYDGPTPTAIEAGDTAVIRVTVQNTGDSPIYNLWLGMDIWDPSGEKVENTTTPVPDPDTGEIGLIDFVNEQGLRLDPGSARTFAASYTFTTSVTGHEYADGAYTYRFTAWADGYPGLLTEDDWQLSSAIGSLQTAPLNISLPVPDSPSDFHSSSKFSDRITWEWQDNSNNEDGFRIDPSGTTVGENVESKTETGLGPNTYYTRHVHAYNSSGDSDPSNSASAYTLPKAPDVSCDHSTGVSYPLGTAFTFTNQAGWGTGNLDHYHYVWDRNSSHIWTGSEPTWSSATLQRTGTSAGNWYLHLTSHNPVHESGGTADYGPYAIGDPSDDPDYVIASLSRCDTGGRQPGGTIEVSWATENQGSGDAVSSSTTSIYLSTDTTINTSDIWLYDDSVPALAGGGGRDDETCVTITVPGTVTADTSYYIGAIADRTGVISESNEGNNTRSDGTVYIGIEDPSDWPQITGGQVQSSPALGDLDGDGSLEVVVGSADNKVYAWYEDGTLVPGWPKETSGSVWSSPTLSDLDGDGSLDVVVGSDDGNVYAWQANGSPVPGWPRTASGRVSLSSPALGDLDGDESLDVVVGSEGGVYAWRGDGTDFPGSGWPKTGIGNIWSSPTLGDLNGDGNLDVVVGSMNGNVYAWSGDGTDLPGWPKELGETGHQFCTSAALGDLNGDGSLDVILGSYDGNVYAWQGDGNPVNGWPQDAGGGVWSSVALGDLDGDGQVDVVVGSANRVHAWHADGTPLGIAFEPTSTEFSSSPALGDLDGDGSLEVVVGSDNTNVYAWYGDGRVVPGWPKSTGDKVRSSPALGDLDGDGHVEVVVGSWDNKVYVWSCGTTTTDLLPWPQFQHDVRRTGNTEFPFPEPPPVADFVGSPTSGEAPLFVEFADLSTNSPTSWSWDFGDGGGSALQNPSHEYASAGTYTVSLIASNACGSDTEMKVDYIIATCARPQADFVGSPTSGEAPLFVEFADLSTNSPTSWDWSFGDGGTSSEQNPSHTYTTASTYTVSLTATNAGGSDTETKTDYIAVSAAPPPAPVADFSGSPTSGDAPLTVNFTDLSTNSPTSWSWDFGDARTSTAQNPSHDYTSAGDYTVSLTATNAGGSDTETKTDYIWVSENHDPDLSNGSVSPENGNTTTTFSYTVDCYDQDGDAPSTKAVYIDGSLHAMTLISGSAANGTYRYQTPLAAGSHEYYFYFTDGNGGSDRLPLSNTFSGPRVDVRMVIDLPVGIVQFSVPLLNPDRVDGRFTLQEIICDPSAVVSHPDTGEVAWRSPTAQAYTYYSIDALLNPGSSYFLETSSPCSLDVTGTPFNLNVDVSTGWNMIGAGSESCSWSECSHPPVDSGPWRWDTDQDKYVAASTLEPGLGYWIHTTAAGDVTCSSASAGALLPQRQTATSPVFGPLPPSDGPVLMDFDDVPEDYWAYPQIGEMRWLGVVAGYSVEPPIFRPNEPVSRAQMAVFICRAYLIPGLGLPAPSFTDVPSDHWAYRYIEALHTAGIVGGYPDGTYHPDFAVSRDQMAVFLARATKLELVDPINPPFADVPADHWAAPAIAAVKDAGISQGYPRNPPTYHPHETVTRDQMCVFLDRALGCPPAR